MKKLIYLSLSLLILTKVSATEICPRLTLQETIQNGHDCNPYGEIIIKVEGLDDGVYNHNFYYDTPDNKAVAFGNATVVSGVLKLSVLPGVYRNIRFSEDSVCGNIGDVTIYDVAQPLSFYHPKFCSLENKTLSDLMATMPGVKWFKGNVEITDKNIPLVEGDEYNYQSGCLRIPYIVQVDNVEKPQVTVDCPIVLGKAKITVANPVEGYTYSLNGGAFQTSLEFTSVPNGSHVITAKSNNDCTAQSDKITIFCDPIEPVVNIPDPEFKRSLVENKSINTNGDNEIQFSEAENFTGILSIGGFDPTLITDVTGIEAFVNITELESNSDFSSIDLSKNIKLTRLNLNNFQKASSLDLSNNKLLNYLMLTNGIELRSLDFSNNPELINLIILETNITQLNVTKNYKLEQLHIGGCLLKELDISNNKELKTFASNSFYTYLEKIDVSNNIKLEYFSIEYSSFLEEVDLSKNINLKIVSFRDNDNLRKLNLKNGNNKNMGLYLIGSQDFTFNSLNCVMVDDPEYSKLNWTIIPEGSKIDFTTDCATLSVSENELNTLNTTFSPNPTQGKITFTEKVDEVKVFDLSGRLVKSTIANTTEVDLSDLQNGVYMMQVNQGQKMFTTKVVKE